MPCRYPVILRRFELRPGSGGRGRFRGGDGVIRELLFREEALLSVLTERRAFRPYGLHGGRLPSSAPQPLFPPCPLPRPPVSAPSSPLPAGGEPGACGLNLLIRRDGRMVNLGGKTSVPVFPGVRIAAGPALSAPHPPSPIPQRVDRVEK